MKRTVPDCRAYGGTCECRNDEAITCPHPDDIAALPPLPSYARNAGGGSMNAYGRDQMHDYALSAIANSAPNKALVEALQQISRNETTVFDDDLGCYTSVSMSDDEMIEVARAALNAADLEGA